MENRDRDKMSQSDDATDAGDVNRSTSEKKGRVSSDSDADFGQNIGRSENLEDEPSRRSGNTSPITNEPSRRGNSNTSGSEH